MSVTVSIPTPLRSFTGGRDAVAVVGATVGQVLDQLLAAHTGLKRHLVQDDGRLRTFVNLYLNDTDIRQLSSTATPVAEASCSRRRAMVKTSASKPSLSPLKRGR